MSKNFWTFTVASLTNPSVLHFQENVCVRTSKNNKVFEFERVYSPAEAQENVFDEVQPMLTSLLDG